MNDRPVSPLEPGALLQVRGETADHRADVFAFGAVLVPLEGLAGLGPAK